MLVRQDGASEGSEENKYCCRALRQMSSEGNEVCGHCDNVSVTCIIDDAAA